jgi:uncharacterized protein
VWLKVIWGGKSEPAFASSAQAQRVISLIMRRFNAISSMFNEPPAFAPILYEREVEGSRCWSADDWCWGFLEAIHLTPETWQALVEDEDNRWMLLPIVALGSEEWLGAASGGPQSGCRRASGTGGAGTCGSGDQPLLARRVAQAESGTAAGIDSPALTSVGRNELCPCGSGRKYKRCCTNAQA